MKQNVNVALSAVREFTVLKFKFGTIDTVVLITYENNRVRRSFHGDLSEARTERSTRRTLFLH